MNQAQLNDLQAEKLKAEIALKKAEASKFRAEGTYIRRKDAMLKTDQADVDASTYEQRILEFTREISEKSVAKAITTLSEWRAKGKDDITIRLSAPGGEVVAGFALYDYILALRAENIKVYTIGLGWAPSMGAVLLQAGTKRYMAPNAHMLIHEIAIDELGGSLPHIEDWVIFMHMLEKRGNMVLAERSTMTEVQIINRMKRKDWWLGAEEAVRLGFADDLWPPKKRGRRNA